MRRSTATLIFAMSTALVIACGTTESSKGDVIVKQTLEDLPNCSNGKFGAVYYVVSEDTFYFCDGGAFIPVDLSGQDGTSCTVTDDGAGTVTIACEDGTVATVSNGEDGQNGQDGQDGTSCTVTRDDAAGTTTVRCEDGTVAVVEDGQDGTSCTVADTATGASITCGSDTVTITDGQDGSSCGATTDGSGAVTISCEDGTSATIPAGDGGDAVALVCGLISENGLQAPDGLECPLICPCFSEADLLAASVTGCRSGGTSTIVSNGQDLVLVQESVTDTLPLTRPTPDYNGSGVGPFVPEVGDFVVYGLGDGQSGFALCESPSGVVDPLTFLQLRDCTQIIENAAGPCEVLPQVCSDSSDCADIDDGNPCTTPGCLDGGYTCANVNRPNGTSCEYSATEQGQCLLGSCQPVLGGL